jgi:uncharacterized protein YeaO (DUF488 family)
MKTKRWNDPAEADDGSRLLVTRYRPRGVKAEAETWEAWLPQLAPSKELHAAAYGKGQDPIAWDEYVTRYHREMEAQRFWIEGLAQRVAAGESITLLCSSACVDPARCHRTLLRALIEDATKPASKAPERSEDPRVIRRKR